MISENIADDEYTSAIGRFFGYLMSGTHDCELFASLVMQENLSMTPRLID